MKKKRITCPICKKRIMDIGLNGEAFLDIKCPHCGKVITIQCSNKPPEENTASPPKDLPTL